MRNCPGGKRSVSNQLVSEDDGLRGEKDDSRKRKKAERRRKRTNSPLVKGKKGENYQLTSGLRHDLGAFTK